MSSTIRKTFDENGVLTLTRSEVDEILIHYDQTDPALQRQITAVFAGLVTEAEGLLIEVNRQAGNSAQADRRHALTPQLRDDIQHFLAK